MKHFINLLILSAITVMAVSCEAPRKPITKGGGVQPELELHYPEGYTPMDKTAAAATLTFPKDFTGEDLTALLRTEHPRLYATSEDWQRVREQIPTNPYLKATRDIVVKRAEELLSKPPEERIMTGRRILLVSREVLVRVLTLASAYRITEDPRYFERARIELLHVAGFSDWNPSHFLDVAEMTMALAIGYDWLYHDLSNADRITLRDAIRDKGLTPGMGPAEADTITYWKLKDNNWVQVCFGSMVGGALAIAEDEPELAAMFLRETFTHIHQSLDAYAPDGAYPEGPGYWTYATHYSVMLISMLQSSLGTTWELENYPGFQSSGLYMNLIIGPTNKLFNYSDGDEQVEFNPALHWLAARAGNASIDARERHQLISNSTQEDGGAFLNRFYPFALLWIDPDLKETPNKPSLPLHWSADGLNPVSFHRSSWDKDGLFLGIKGGTPSNNHGHMDIGSFVLDWKGVRWAIDFGSQDYTDLEQLGMHIWGYKDQQSERWDVFRLNNQSHNTWVIDDQPQLLDGFASIKTFSADPDTPFSVLDMSTVYRNSVDRAIRGVRFVNDHTLLIHDELEGLAKKQSARWGFVTEAEVELNRDQAELKQEGQMLHARILSPEGAIFEIVKTDPPPHGYDAPNPGTRMLAVVLKGDGKPTDLRVVLSGSEINESMVNQVQALPLPSNWQAR